MSYITMVKTIDLIRFFGLSRYRDNAESRHKLVMALFPQDLGDNPRETNKILFRFEKDSKGSRCLIRSSIPVANLPGVKSLNEGEPNFKAGENIFFRTVANPIKRNGNKEIFIAEIEDQEEWLKDKLKEALEDIEIIEIKSETVKRGLKKSNFLKLSQFDGVATVKNPEILKDLLENGFGRGKSYGAGLLTVKRM